MRTGILLLAAGNSRRFGSDKRLATLANGEQLLSSTVAAIALSDLPLLVCLGEEDHALYRTLTARGLDCLRCRGSADGMGSTLAAGVRGKPADWDGVIVALADMAWITAASYAAVSDAMRADRIVVPHHRGCRGHPVGFGRDFVCHLLSLKGDKGARYLLDTYPEAIYSLELDDPGIHLDADTPDALGQAQLRADRPGQHR